MILWSASAQWRWALSKQAWPASLQTSRSKHNSPWPRRQNTSKRLSSTGIPKSQSPRPKCGPCHASSSERVIILACLVTSPTGRSKGTCSDKSHGLVKIALKTWATIERINSGIRVDVTPIREAWATQGAMSTHTIAIGIRALKDSCLRKNIILIMLVGRIIDADRHHSRRISRARNGSHRGQQMRTRSGTTEGTLQEVIQSAVLAT